MERKGLFSHLIEYFVLVAKPIIGIYLAFSTASFARKMKLKYVRKFMICCQLDHLKIVKSLMKLMRRK